MTNRCCSLNQVVQCSTPGQALGEPVGCLAEATVQQTQLWTKQSLQHCCRRCPKGLKMVHDECCNCTVASILCNVRQSALGLVQRLVEDRSNIVIQSSTGLLQSLEMQFDSTCKSLCVQAGGHFVTYLFGTKTRQRQIRSSTLRQHAIV